LRQGQPRTSLLRLEQDDRGNLKDEVDKRAYHKMLRQLCLREKELE
jgi:hypothetical protein